MRAGERDAEYSRADVPPHVRRVSLSIGALALLMAFAVPPQAIAQVDPTVPVVRFHLGGEELLPVAYPERYGPGSGGALDDDIEWVEDNAGDLVAWWERNGLPLLQRVGDYAGLSWPYRDIEVYLVRRWPVVSIERPLVLALDAIDAGGDPVDVPTDDDVRVLLLAHQITHYLLDPPAFAPGMPRDDAYDHPFLRPGAFDAEAMVNWVVYRALEDLWGRERLREATADELWRAYNPNHEYVVDELEPRHRLSRGLTLREWLADHPEGSEIFRVRDAYLRQAGGGAAPPSQVDRERISGTDYGIDLGASHDGRVFVAYVDASSPAARVGVEQGDIVRTIEGRDVTNVAEAQAAMDASWDDNAEINLSVERGGQEVFFSIEAP